MVDNQDHLYVLDGWGGVHPVGTAPALRTSASWPHKDIAFSLAIVFLGALAGMAVSATGGAVALLLSWFLGTLGVDRFYLGYTGLGVAKLLTGGGCLVWWLIDFIMIAMNKVPDAEGRPLQK